MTRYRSNVKVGGDVNLYLTQDGYLIPIFTVYGEGLDLVFLRMYREESRRGKLG